MTNTYVAFLRGINVGGNVMLPMKELAAICEGVGFKEVRTYINSGNVLFASGEKEEVLIKKLEAALKKKKGRDIAVMVRSEKELQSILVKNPFKTTELAKIGVTLFAKPISKDLPKEIRNVGTEKIHLSKRELYIYYPDGMGRSKLVFPKTAAAGTVRNMNTITKLVALLQK